MPAANISIAVRHIGRLFPLLYHHNVFDILPRSQPIREDIEMLKTFDIWLFLSTDIPLFRS